MSLETFRRSKMIVLAPHSTAYQAARAMMDNHIGSVLVGGPKGLSGIITDRDLALAVLGGDLNQWPVALGDVMSESVVTCDIGVSLGEVARLMVENNVRRIPIMENGNLVGLVTFDDLVVDGSVGPETLRAIVTAQLEVEAPRKPAGALHPEKPGRAERGPAAPLRALMRAQARAEESYSLLAKAVGTATGLKRARSEKALLIVLSMLCRRLSPEEAGDLIAQLPSKLQPELDVSLDGPDRNITAEVIRDELGRALDMDDDDAEAVLQGVCRTLAQTVSPGQIDEVRGQLPERMKYLFPS